jgi:acyl-CoA synthetase (NDP forming)
MLIRDIIDFVGDARIRSIMLYIEGIEMQKKFMSAAGLQQTYYGY